MCSRYEIGDRVQRFLIPYGWNQQLRAGDVHPQEKAPVRTRDGGGISACSMAWGMTHPNTGKLIINAREETAAEKPMFSRSLRTQRCILPAEKFYEWDAKKHKDCDNETLSFHTGMTFVVLYFDNIVKNPFGLVLRDCYFRRNFVLIVKNREKIRTSVQPRAAPACRMHGHPPMQPGG